MQLIRRNLFFMAQSDHTDTKVCKYQILLNLYSVLDTDRFRLRHLEPQDHGHLKGISQILDLDYEVFMSMRDNPLGYHIDLEITLDRKFGRCFIENIAPSGLLVVVSWASENIVAFIDYKIVTGFFFR